MRGIPDYVEVLAPKRRITPVYAGNTQRSRQLFGDRWDHPRLCGEYLQTLGTTHSAIGSPPSMRGILPLVRP